jgi:hypothetical protein
MVPLADVHQDLARSIKSIRVSQNLFDDLSDDPADWEIAQQHELATKPHTYASPATLIDRPFEEADWLCNRVSLPQLGVQSLLRWQFRHLAWVGHGGDNGLRNRAPLALQLSRRCRL